MKKELTLQMVRPTVNLPIDRCTIRVDESTTKQFDFDVILQSGTKLQREHAWVLEQEQAVIDTLLRGDDIGVITLIRRYNTETLEVIDGQHRLKAIRKFCNNEFPIIVDEETYYFYELDIETTRWFFSQYISCKVVNESVYFHKRSSALSSAERKVITEQDIANMSKITDIEKVQLFHAVSYTGTPQDRKHIENLYNSLLKP